VEEGFTIICFIWGPVDQSQPAYSGYEEIKRSNITLEKNSNIASQGLGNHY